MRQVPHMERVMLSLVASTPQVDCELMVAVDSEFWGSLVVRAKVAGTDRWSDGMRLELKNAAWWQIAEFARLCDTVLGCPVSKEVERVYGWRPEVRAYMAAHQAATGTAI